MKKSACSFTVLVVLTFNVPSLKAERLGTNPHPRAAVATSSLLSGIIFTLRNYLGM